MSYYDDFEAINLINKFNEFHVRLNLLGSLYDMKCEVPNEEQKIMLKFATQGYSLDEQIHDCYSEIGAVRQAMEKLIV